MIAMLKKATNNSILILLFTHSVCCFLPIVSLLLGINLMSTLTLHGYEKYLLAANLFLIGVGVYFNFLHRSNKKCKHHHDDCKTNNKKFLIISIISLFVILYQYFSH